MAKRKRLTPAIFNGDTPPGTQGPSFDEPRRPPIADVSGAAAAQSALEEVTEELRKARDEGRMVVRLPLAAVEAGHLVRDRISLDADEMRVLSDSLRARGQQAPIEVVDLGAGRFGLISGWRRLMALRELHAETGADRFATVQALIRVPKDAGAAYCAMVEENEIRSDLSFYERARIAVEAARHGIFSDPKEAIQSLFSTARAPKRSKIGSFVHLVEMLDSDLRFPAAIPEKLGLALVGVLTADPEAGARLRVALREAKEETPEAERAVLEAALRPPRRAAPAFEEIAPGIALNRSRHKLTLSGPSVDADLERDLRAWLSARKIPR